jgi:deferrochelatase/peroxidase EfeB
MVILPARRWARLPRSDERRRPNSSAARVTAAGGETDQPWPRGGSYLVARKIRMFIENWDRDYLADQERVIGRSKVGGAPLPGGTEFTAPDFGARDSGGGPAIPADAHIRLASLNITAAPASSGAATPSPTGSTRRRARCWAGCC